VLAGHKRQVGAVAVLDAAHAISGSRDGTCRIWQLATGASRALRPHALPLEEEK